MRNGSHDRPDVLDRTALTPETARQLIDIHLRDQPEEIRETVVAEVIRIHTIEDPVQQIEELVELVRSNLAFKAQLRVILGTLFKQNQRLAEIEDRLASKDQQIKEAKIDLLTKLPGRIAFEENVPDAVRSALEASPDMPYHVSFLMIDIDHFKKVNDTYGHDHADVVLKRVAELIKENVPRDSDFVSRFGGEEFVVALFNCPLENAIQIAEKIRMAVAEEKFNLPFNGGSREHQSTISIGVSSMALHNQVMMKEKEVIFELRVVADVAMYQSKETGRNRVTSMTDLDPQILQAKRQEAAELASNKK